MYGGGDKMGAGGIILLSRAFVSMEGTLSKEELLKALESIPFDKIEAMTASTGSGNE